MSVCVCVCVGRGAGKGGGGGRLPGTIDLPTTQSVISDLISFIINNFDYPN